MYVQFLFTFLFFFFFIPERNIPAVNVAEMGSCGMDIQVSKCRRENSVWILKNSEYAGFLLSCGVFGQVLNGSLPFKSAKGGKRETRICDSA